MSDNISYAVYWNTKDSGEEFTTQWYALHEQAQLAYDRISKSPNCGKIRMVKRYEQFELVQQNW